MFFEVSFETNNVRKIRGIPGRKYKYSIITMSELSKIQFTQCSSNPAESYVNPNYVSNVQWCQQEANFDCFWPLVELPGKLLYKKSHGK